MFFSAMITLKNTWEKAKWTKHWNMEKMVKTAQSTTPKMFAHGIHQQWSKLRQRSWPQAISILPQSLLLPQLISSKIVLVNKIFVQRYEEWLWNTWLREGYIKGLMARITFFSLLKKLVWKFTNLNLQRNYILVGELLL